MITKFNLCANTEAGVHTNPDPNARPGDGSWCSSCLTARHWFKCECCEHPVHVRDIDDVDVRLCSNCTDAIHLCHPWVPVTCPSCGTVERYGNEGEELDSSCQCLTTELLRWRVYLGPTHKLYVKADSEQAAINLALNRVGRGTSTVLNAEYVEAVYTP